MKKILFIDDEDLQIEGMGKLFSDERLKGKCTFTAKQFLMDEGNGLKKPEKQFKDILDYLKGYIEEDKIDILMVDMVLDGKSTNDIPLGLKIINALIEEKKYNDLVVSGKLIILFTTVYTQNKEYINNEEIWQKEFLSQNKPSFSKVPTYRKECPPALAEKCAVLKAGKPIACPQSECFIQYMMNVIVEKGRSDCE